MSKESSSKKPKIHRQKTYELSLTKHELLHIRDMLGVLLPPSGEKTISQALAELENRSIIESMLWDKVSKLCVDAKLPLNNEAPDYVVAPSGPPPLGIFHINHELEQPSQEDSSGFLPGQEFEDNEEEAEEDE